MALFDTLELDYPLPDRRHQDLEFHTKDLEGLERFLQRYSITWDGRLLKHGRGRVLGDGDGLRLESDVELPVHGVLLMYAADPDADHGLIQYLVRFAHGRVERIARFEGFGQALRKGLEAPGPAASVPPREPVPGAWGRPITAEELRRHAPELELVDGRIVGDKGLLLLILTSLGLRRAAALVGHDAWRKGLE